MADQEDPLLRRTRIETANALGNAIVDVINEHVRTHGAHDPELQAILLAALADVVSQIDEKLDPNFSMTLAQMFGPDDYER